jgi:hypothetical protein
VNVVFDKTALPMNEKLDGSIPFDVNFNRIQIFAAIQVPPPKALDLREHAVCVRFALPRPMAPAKSPPYTRYRAPPVANIELASPSNFKAARLDQAALDRAAQPLVVATFKRMGTVIFSKRYLSS